MKTVFCLMVMTFGTVSSCKIADPNPPASLNVAGSGIVFMGDTGSGNSDQYRVAEGGRKFCEINFCNFGLLLGDNIYEFGVKTKTDPQFQTKFEQPYKNLNFKFYVALGNHDHYGHWEAEVDYASDHWAMPTRYYSLTSDFATIYVLDTEKLNKEQIAWLDSSLATRAKPWVIVIGHHPMYSSGMHGDTHELKEHILPLLTKYKVDFYLSGHDHDQEITERDGLTYVVAGAGSETRKLGTSKYQLWGASALGFSHLALKQDQAILRMLGADGQTLFEKKYQRK